MRHGAWTSGFRFRLGVRRQTASTPKPPPPSQAGLLQSLAKFLDGLAKGMPEVPEQQQQQPQPGSFPSFTVTGFSSTDGFSAMAGFSSLALMQARVVYINTLHEALSCVECLMSDALLAKVPSSIGVRLVLAVAGPEWVHRLLACGPAGEFVHNGLPIPGEAGGHGCPRVPPPHTHTRVLGFHTRARMHAHA